MTHRALRGLERQLDRIALELAFSYVRLLDTMLDDAQTRRKLDPAGTFAASVTAKAAALRELVRHIAPPTTVRLDTVWAVMRPMSAKPVGAFSTREAAEGWLHRHGGAASGFEVHELPIEPPDTTLVEEFERRLQRGRQLVAEVERELGPIPAQLLREVDEAWLEAEADFRPPDATDADSASDPDAGDAA